jgi:Uma2 family endonuclease
MSQSSALPVPALENGDRLSRAEFERRYAAMPDVKKAELIEGVVYFRTSGRALTHGEPCGMLVGWIGTYAAVTSHVCAAANATVRLDLDNEPQPDVLLRIDEAAGGQSRISDDDYVEGAPELIAEVAHSSAAYDLHDKKQAYRRNGVQEYLVWQIEENRVDWFVLEEGTYVRLEPGEDGHVASRVFPGLVLDVEALQNRNAEAVLSLVQETTGGGEHQAFISRLTEQLDSSDS